MNEVDNSTRFIWLFPVDSRLNFAVELMERNRTLQQMQTVNRERVNTYSDTRFDGEVRRLLTLQSEI